MMLTKAGFKLWASGMLVIIMDAVVGALYTEETMDSLSLGELVFIFVVLWPLAIGWVQRWFWLRGTTQESTDGA